MCTHIQVYCCFIHYVCHALHIPLLDCYSVWLNYSPYSMHMHTHTHTHTHTSRLQLQKCKKWEDHCTGEREKGTWNIGLKCESWRRKRESEQQKVSERERETHTHTHTHTDRLTDRRRSEKRFACQVVIGLSRVQTRTLVSCSVHSAAACVCVCVCVCVSVHACRLPAKNELPLH